MAQLVYACRFDVAASEGTSIVLSTYRAWIAGHYRIRHGLTSFEFDPETIGMVEGLPANHALSSSIYHDGEERSVLIQWSYPDDNNIGLRWSNEIHIGQFSDCCSIEHLILIESIEYNISPAMISIGSPRAIRDICSKTRALVGEMQIRAEPYPLNHGELIDLLQLLTSSSRKLPIVLLSPFAQGEPNQIDPVRLARNLAGVAVVANINDPEVTWDFADEVGRQLSCYNGAARIYWPGFAMDSDPRSHRLFFGAWINQFGPIAAARTIERTIFTVAAFRFVPNKRIADLVRRVEAAERHKLFEEKKAAGDTFWEQYDNDLALLDEARKKIEELNAENANLKANQKVFFSSGFSASDDLDNTDEEANVSFSSTLEAVKRAAEISNNIEILPSAFTAANNSPYQKPYDIYKALTDLNKIVDIWQQNRDRKGSGGDLLQHLRDHGWGKRSSMHISETTRGKFRSDYEFDYQGKKQLFEPHITIGAGDANSCASIHFIFDQKRLKMVVGYVGRHLSNTKT